MMAEGNEDNPDYWINMGFSLTQQGKRKESIKYYKKALELDPENFVALMNIANAYAEGDVEERKEAEKNLLYLTRCYPDSVEGWINLGVFYGEEGKINEEMDCYTKALQLDPSRAEIWHNRGRLYKTIKWFREAISDFEESLRLRPDHIDTVYDKGYAHFHLNEINDAEECYDKVIELDPMHADAISDKGAVLAHKGKYAEAIPFFDRALKNQMTVATRVRTLRNKAIALRQLGESENADKCDQEADDLGN
jgi:tetratricopeptide (TPR) repeat protein